MLEHILPRPARLFAFAVHQFAFKCLEEGFRERVVLGISWPRHGLGNPTGLQSALERPGRVLAALAVMENEGEAIERLSLPTAYSSASENNFLVRCPDIDQPMSYPVERVNYDCEV